ncbi:MAG TPA: metalloregulator ArsR/SmtB family transcription factor [Gammaproteobacteria bacterium]|nr:metalloregulator ArsR/SmtB family transcription factor [Gammaproteobacteria bacterium]
MKQKTAVNAFAALGHDTRLGIFRLLVEAGPEGLPASEIAKTLVIQPSNLTFHIAHLTRASLVRSRRDGRWIIYSADFGAMNALVDFLTQKCCGGDPQACRDIKSEEKAS